MSQVQEVTHDELLNRFCFAHGEMLRLWRNKRVFGPTPESAQRYWEDVCALSLSLERDLYALGVDAQGEYYARGGK